MGYGDPRTAKLGFMLEAPGNGEVKYRLRNGNFGPLDTAELTRRSHDYPDIPREYITLGAALVGPSWYLLAQWMLNKFGLRREDLFIDNVLRCLHPKGKGGAAYPTGTNRKLAEAWCRQYDRWDQFRPTIVFVAIHPAALMRSITPLPLIVRVIEKARDAADAGERPVVCFGGKAANAWLNYGENVQKWVGTYAWSKEPITKFEHRLTVGVKVPKVKPGPVKVMI